MAGDKKRSSTAAWIRIPDSGPLAFCGTNPANPIKGPYYLSNIFMETLGKRVGSSAIRKAHVTELYKDGPSIKEKQALARIINHTPETAEDLLMQHPE